MSKGDKSLRGKAIPFESLPSNNGAELTSLTQGNFFAPPTFDYESRFFTIRMSRPTAGNLVELFLSMSLTADNVSGFGLKIAIGSFANGNFDPTPEYAQSLINASHLAISGQTASFSAATGATLVIDELPIFQGLPQPGDPTYTADGYVLVLAFDGKPSATTGWALNSFKVKGSVQLGVS